MYILRQVCYIMYRKEQRCIWLIRNRWIHILPVRYMWFRRALPKGWQSWKRSYYSNSDAKIWLFRRVSEISSAVILLHSILKIFSQSSKSTFHLLICGNRARRLPINLMSRLLVTEVRKIRIWFSMSFRCLVQWTKFTDSDIEMLLKVAAEKRQAAETAEPGYLRRRKLLFALQ